MAGKQDIFARPRLKSSQLRAVAQKRWGDASCLLESGDRARMNGAMYLGGFVIECLLKAALLDRHPNLSTVADPALLSKPDREVYALMFRHELDHMLFFLPEIEKRLKAAGGLRDWMRFRDICSQWTIFARYSPQSASTSDAKRFLETIGEVKQWLSTL
jgi:hypothetical protein